MHFFNISTSKTAPRPPVFNTFDFQMCFAPQRRALFRHRNLQKWSEPLVLCTFWLGNVLRATTACTFSTSQLPQVVRPWCGLYILPCKCASRHNGVHFFISHLASWLRTRRFSEPTFRPSGATNHWKNTVFRDFPTFSRICIFFLLTLSLLIFSLLIFLFSLPLPCSAFHLSILSEVWLLNFLRLYIYICVCVLHIILYCIILYYIILCYVILCYIMLYYVILYYAKLCYVILCYVKSFCVMLYYVISYYIILCYIVLYHIILCYTMLYYIMLYYAILCYIMLYYICLYCMIPYYIIYIYILYIYILLICVCVCYM